MGNQKLFASVIVTYRCNAKCNMCDCFLDPTKKEEEFSPDLIKKLPKLAFANITGGEPFIREDIDKIVEELYKKTDRIVISTNGFFYDRILKLCDKFPDIGIRISIEGLPKSNDEIRGIKDGFERGIRTLLTLTSKGHKDVGFGMTVQDKNAHDLVLLYNLSNFMGMEFATATLHNSFYFRKTDNKIEDVEMVSKVFANLIKELLKSNSPKKWFRAYFNHGLINYLYGQKRLLPCEMGSDAFFLDPYGDVIPCNGMETKMPMGNLHKQSFEEIWKSKDADNVRKCVENCDRNCWMIGSASPAMKKNIMVPLKWVIQHKFLKKGYCLSENYFIGK